MNSRGVDHFAWTESGEPQTWDRYRELFVALDGDLKNSRQLELPVDVYWESFYTIA